MVILDESIQFAFNTLVGLIPVSTLAAVVYFAAEVKSSAKTTATALNAFAEATNKRLDGHDEIIGEHREKIATLWYGHERRNGVNDRRHKDD